jgi:hypothetical protein
MLVHYRNMGLNAIGSSDIEEQKRDRMGYRPSMGRAGMISGVSCGSSIPAGKENLKSIKGSEYRGGWQTGLHLI